jgi:hypothetical protein
VQASEASGILSYTPETPANAGECPNPTLGRRLSIMRASCFT